MVEVPGEEDDMAYHIWHVKKAKESTLPAMKVKPAPKPLMLPKSPSWERWFKPFKVDWMLHAICEARNNNAAQAALCV